MTEMNGTEIYYWDSCIFLAWLRDEDRKEGEMAAVKSYVRKLESRQIKIMTSAIAYTEVTSTKLPDGVDQIFFDFMKRSSVQIIGADIRVTQQARKLRDYYRLNWGKNLCTPDAIHLATAILYKAKEFNTFDESNKNKSLGLLQLDGDVGGHSLTVCKPQLVQEEIDF
jgi:predicted nucleic acid-binding protein